MLSRPSQRVNNLSIQMDYTVRKSGTSGPKPKLPDEDDVFLIKSREKRPLSPLSVDSGRISSRQSSILLKSSMGSRPSTSSLPRRRASYSARAALRPSTAGKAIPSREVSRPSTVSSGYQSAGPVRGTPKSGWLPHVNNVNKTAAKDSDKERKETKSQGLLVLKSSQDSNLTDRSVKPPLRVISRSDSLKRLDNSKDVESYSPKSARNSTCGENNIHQEGDKNKLARDDTLIKTVKDDSDNEDNLDVSGSKEEDTDVGNVKQRHRLTNSSRKISENHIEEGNSQMSAATSTKSRSRRVVSSKRRRSPVGKGGRPAGLVDKRPAGGVTGMTHFAIGKDGTIIRTVMRFSRPPERMPLTVCFHYPNNFLTHRYVLDQVKNQILTIPNGYVTTVQFIDRNVLHGTMGLENRWLVALNCPEARDQLLRMDIKVFDRKIKLRRADDVIHEEYREFLKYERLLKALRGEGELEDNTKQEPENKVDVDIDNDNDSVFSEHESD